MDGVRTASEEAWSVFLREFKRWCALEDVRELVKHLHASGLKEQQPRHDPQQEVRDLPDLIPVHRQPPSWSASLDHESGRAKKTGERVDAVRTSADQAWGVFLHEFKRWCASEEVHELVKQLPLLRSKNHFSCKSRW